MPRSAFGKSCPEIDSVFRLEVHTAARLLLALLSVLAASTRHSRSALRVVDLINHWRALVSLLINFPKSVHFYSSIWFLILLFHIAVFFFTKTVYIFVCKFDLLCLTMYEFLEIYLLFIFFARVKNFLLRERCISRVLKLVQVSDSGFYKVEFVLDQT